MKALITNIRYKKLDKRHSYWIITINDVNGNLIEELNLSHLSNAQNFRVQTYGILAAINCFDLLRLFTNEPDTLPIYVDGSVTSRLDYLKNLKGHVLKYSDDKYIVEKGLFKSRKKSEHEIEGNISSITSMSGTFGIQIDTEYFSTYFSTGQIYYGFGYPLTSSYQSNENAKTLSCDMFKSFIESILSFYNTNDLIDLGRTQKIEYPIVEVEFDDNGHINAIGSVVTNFYLVEGPNSYSIINKTEDLVMDEKKKTLTDMRGNNDKNR